MLNGELVHKEVETELLRLDHYNFQVSFNNYKGPQTSELVLVKDGQKSIKVDKKIITSAKVLEPIEKLMPADLDGQFYHDLNTEIIQRIYRLRSGQEAERGHHIEIPQQVMQESKYGLYTLFNQDKADIEVYMYYPSHFQALRKLYCGHFHRQAEQLFKSSFWADVTGGKSRSEFYRSYDEKLIMKVINSNEMRMFNDFAPSYFEYMCRSFFQKCPTSIGKILGAFRITMKMGADRTTKSWNVIMMESLTIGMNPKATTIAKYDLKGSMSNRYVDLQAKGKHVTKLDTNFLEDRDS